MPLKRFLFFYHVEDGFHLFLYLAAKIVYIYDIQQNVSIWEYTKSELCSLSVNVK